MNYLLIVFFQQTSMLIARLDHCLELLKLFNIGLFVSLVKSKDIMRKKKMMIIVHQRKALSLEYINENISPHDSDRFSYEKQSE